MVCHDVTSTLGKPSSVKVGSPGAAAIACRGDRQGADLALLDEGIERREGVEQDFYVAGDQVGHRRAAALYGTCVIFRPVAG
jgi:hypothetical protein